MWFQRSALCKLHDSRVSWLPRQEAAAADGTRAPPPRPRTPPEEKEREEKEALEADAALDSYLDSFAQAKRSKGHPSKGAKVHASRPPRSTPSTCGWG